MKRQDQMEKRKTSTTTGILVLGWWKSLCSFGWVHRSCLPRALAKQPMNYMCDCTWLMQWAWEKSGAQPCEEVAGAANVCERLPPAWRGTCQGVSCCCPLQLAQSSQHLLFQSVHALSFHGVDLCYFKIECLENGSCLDLLVSNLQQVKFMLLLILEKGCFKAFSQAFILIINDLL